VNYGGTWYAWSLGTIVAVLSPTVVVYASGNNLLINGPVT
jgi:hypothetical protein